MDDNQTMKQECAQKLTNVSHGTNYSQLLKQLIVQGLIKIEEQTVVIQCRQEDNAKVTQVVRLFTSVTSRTYFYIVVVGVASGSYCRVSSSNDGSWSLC